MVCNRDNIAAFAAKKSSMEDKILTLLRAKRNLLTLMCLSIAVLFAVGCGGSRDNFVATGTNNNNTGAFTFQFVRPQTTVSSQTATLRFDFYSSTTVATANLVLTDTRAFANTITVTGVPANAVFVVVTALDANGVPLQTFTSTLTVIAGTTQNVTLSGATTVTYDSVDFSPTPVNLVVDLETETANSQQVTAQLAFSDNSTLAGTINNTTTSFVFAETGLANVSSTGLFQYAGGENGNVSVTGTYTLNNVSRSETFLVRVFGFGATANASTNISRTAGYDSGYNVRFFDADGSSSINVTSNSTFELVNAPSNLTINSTSGVISNSGTSDTGPFQVRVTWVDGRNGGTDLTFTDLINFLVVEE